jgi:alpha-L-rhamnosidase
MALPFFACVFLAGGSLQPDNLRVEYRANPLGVDVAVPRFSWIDTSSEQNAVQSAYRIEVADSQDLLNSEHPDIWDSGQVNSADSVGIDYNGPALMPGHRYFWKVDVWDGSGESSTSRKFGWWEMGIGTSGWKGQWIGEPTVDVPYFRREFAVDKRIKRARLYATARGLYRATIDGKRVGQGELTPGWTDFKYRLEYETYDVTGLLRRGQNAIGMRLAPGWFSGHVGPSKEIYGTKPQLLAQLQIDYTDGSSETIVTDDSWKAGSGAIRSSDCQTGEVYDGSLDAPGWDKPGFNDSGWSQPTTQALGNQIIAARQSPMVEKIDEIRAKKITEIKPGVFIVDLGQNMVGWCHLNVDGPAGTTVQLRHGEMLDNDGTLYTKNLRGAKATDTFTLGHSGSTSYEPSFTFHGFRYVEITGYPGTPNLNTVRGEVVGSNCPQTGWFDCSDKLVNQLQHNIFWGQRSNYLEVPTDCPQRDERLGWMGDAETFAPSACFNNDIDAFMTKWMHDVDDGQSPQGAFRDVSPAVVVPPAGAPAWADAGVIVPWTVYEAYGDKRMLADNFSFMKKWVDYVDRSNPNHLWINNRNNDYGDWLNVHDETPHELIATAFFANSADIVARTAAVLGEKADAVHYHVLAKAIRGAFMDAFVSPDGAVKGNNQTGYILPLAFGLADEGAGSRHSAMDAKLAAHLVDQIHAHNDHLTAGFVGVGRLNQVLTENGYADVAYKLLLTKTYPSWLYPVTQGATTIWERWDGWTDTKGFQNPGMNSFNHYAMGSVGDWLYQQVGGISVLHDAPASVARPYSRFVIAPNVEPGLSWVKERFDSVVGMVSCSWRTEGDQTVYDIEVPANASADVKLADGNGWFTAHVGGGKYTYTLTSHA